MCGNVLKCVGTFWNVAQVVECCRMCGDTWRKVLERSGLWWNVLKCWSECVEMWRKWRNVLGSGGMADCFGMRRNALEGVPISEYYVMWGIPVADSGMWRIVVECVGRVWM